MTYFPHSQHEINEMLKKINKKSLEDLVTPIPEKFRTNKINLENGRDELSVSKHFNKLAAANKRYDSIFLGGGAYNHYIPAAIDELAGRQEFYSAYTPYQSEVSQGTLQSIFEYQTYMAQLTGMDVANASMYDGATAMVEAVIMSVNQNRKRKDT